MTATSQNVDTTSVPRKGPIEIWIPRRAPNLNDLIRAHAHHPHVYNRIKQDWAQTVALCARGVRLGRCSVHFELVEQNDRRDPDNIAGGTAKLILDGLVKAGTLPSDGWAHVAGLSFAWRVGSPAGVRVVLTPCEETGEKPARAKKARKVVARIPVAALGGGA